MNILSRRCSFVRSSAQLNTFSSPTVSLDHERHSASVFLCVRARDSGNAVCYVRTQERLFTDVSRVIEAESLLVVIINCCYHGDARFKVNMSVPTKRAVDSVVTSDGGSDYYTCILFHRSMFSFACLLRVLRCYVSMILFLFILLSLHVSVCTLLSSHWPTQSGGGCAGPISGVGVRFRGSAGSSGGDRGRSHAAKERISGGGRGGGARDFKVSD